MERRSTGRGRPIEGTTEEMCHEVEDMVMMNRRVTIFQVATELGVGTGSVEMVFHEHLGLSKVCARWVSKMLTPEIKKNRVKCCRETLAVMSAGECCLYRRLLTEDET